jgi:formylglycine-generating enzyme required for sulfatase activity
LEQGNITSKQAEDWETLLRCSDEEFEAWLDESFPGGRHTQPAFWDDWRFNNPAQPVAGVCWYEARAYCNWLAAQTGIDIRLPTEAQREAATRGLEGRHYAYPGDYDPRLCNTFDTHIRRTTPVAVFPGGETPESTVDLTGNVWDWTSSVYDQERFPYPYRGDDGREEPEAVDDDGNPARRVLRGGAWDRTRDRARAAYRTWDEPSFRSSNTDGGCGFRLVVCHPPSQ